MPLERRKDMACTQRAHPVQSRLIRTLLLGSVLLQSALLAVSQAQITLDGSLGPRGPLAGPNYRIGPEVGQIRGSNLFHSFDQFNVPTGGGVTFTGPNTVANILSRVTGGLPSSIDGLLRSEIAGANLYLLNPSGVVFGPNASLNVRGSFHVSTADFLRFADGAKFSANLGQESVLTVASPAAFGFLGPTPAPITIQESVLEVPKGKALSIVGGDIAIEGGPLGFLSAPGGWIQIASVASPGEVGFSRLELAPDLQVDAFARLGRMALSREALLTVSSDDGAGTVLIRGGRLTLDNSVVNANTIAGDSARLGIDLRVAEDIVLTSGAQIRAESRGAGRAGDLRLTAGGAISISGRDSDNNPSAFFTETSGRGNAGHISLSASLLKMEDGRISSTTTGDGDAGDLMINVGRLTVAGGAQIASNSGVRRSGGTVRVGRGQGGTLTITAKDAISISGSVSGVFANTFGSGNAGDISISSPILTMDDGLIQATTRSSGNAGSIAVRAGRLTLTGGAEIDSRTDGAGRGGTLLIEGERLIMDNSFISAATTGDGNSGRLDIRLTKDLAINNEGIILASTFGRGNAGNLSIATPRLTINNGLIEASARRGSSGDAGSLEVRAGSLTLTGGARIDSSTRGSGRGGDLTVAATESIAIAGRNREGIRSGLFSNTFSNGDAGRVFVSTPLLTMDAGLIQALAERGSQGNAGDLDVLVGRLTLTGGAQISNSPRGVGDGGRVTVAATESIAIAGRNSGLFSQADASGDAGNLLISAPTLRMDGGRIEARTLGEGNAGNIEVRVGKLMLMGGAEIIAGIGTSALIDGVQTFHGREGQGRGGDITVVATDMIAIAGRDSLGVPSGLFSNALFGRGNAGNLSIATPLLTMDAGLIQALATRDSRGNAGGIEVRGGSITLTGGAEISSSTFGVGHGGTLTVAATDSISIAGHNSEGFPSGLFSTTRGRGPGGDLQVTAPHIQLSDRGTISASSTGDGAAGTLLLQAGETFRSQQGRVTTAADRAGGGAIALTAGRLVQLSDSELTTTVRGGGGDAGNITLDSPFVVLDGSQIIANAFAGMGGNIRIGAEVFLADPASLVSASSALGIQGMVDIRAPVTTLSGVLAPLPQAFVNVAALLPARCAARLSGGKASSLVVGGREGLPLDPGSLLPSPLVFDTRLVFDARLAADPAVTSAPRRPQSSRFALLALDEKVLPRVQGGHLPGRAVTALDRGCTQ
jgi:filamentous hemagglutinin family protein